MSAEYPAEDIEEAAARPPSDRTRVKRLPKRGRYDRATIDAILGDAIVGHVAWVHEGQPYATPTAVWRQSALWRFRRLHHLIVRSAVTGRSRLHFQALARTRVRAFGRRQFCLLHPDAA